MKHPFQLEHRRQPLATPERFSSRITLSAIWALGLIILALAIGMAGYMGFESMGLIDAFVNAAMILSGMGPVTVLHTDGGKIFAGLYAIFCGLLIFGVAGLLLVPVLHRLLHRFHIEDTTSKNQ